MNLLARYRRVVLSLLWVIRVLCMLVSVLYVQWGLASCWH